MAVYVTAFRHSMVAPLVLIWTLNRTASFCGYISCNVAWDLVNERENRDFKGFVKHAGQHLRDRLGKAADMLNTFKHMKRRFLDGIGKRNDEAYDKVTIKQADRDGILSLLTNKLPATFAACCATDDKNAFKIVPARLRCPWIIVLETAVDQSAAAQQGDDADEDQGSDDEGADGYDSAGNNDDETKEDWFTHITRYLKKMMRQ